MKYRTFRGSVKTEPKKGGAHRSKHGKNKRPAKFLSVPKIPVYILRLTDSAQINKLDKSQTNMTTNSLGKASLCKRYTHLARW